MLRLDSYPGYFIKSKQTLFNPFEEVLVSPSLGPPSLAETEKEKEKEKEKEVEDPFLFLQRLSSSSPVASSSASSSPVASSSSAKATKPVPMDQPRGKSGERLLYTYPNIPTIYTSPSSEFSLLVGSSDKSASAWLIQFDGAANPNPGPASAGAVLWSPKDVNGHRSPVFEMGKFLGKATNNIAEIQGLLLGLKMAAMRGARDILIEGDSELIIRQQTREYKVSNKNLKVWWAEIQAAMMDEISFDWIAIRHVRREFNERADSITKEVLSKRESFTR